MLYVFNENMTSQILDFTLYNALFYFYVAQFKRKNTLWKSI